MHRIGREQCIPGMWKYMLRDFVKGDVLLLCFGGIDVRCHVHHQVRLHHRPLDEITRQLADAYVRLVREMPGIPDHCVRAIMLPLPPTRMAHAYHDPILPTEGTDLERVLYTKSMVHALRAAAARAGNMGVLDVTGAYSDECGLMRSDMSDGCGHIDQAPLLRALVRLGWVRLDPRF